MDDFKRFIRSIEDGNLNEVVTNFRTDFLERITDDEKKWRPIHLACTGTNLDIVKLLLQNQCSLECEDYQNWRPIHLACWSGNFDIVKLLLPNQCSLEWETIQRFRPIHCACRSGNLDIVKLLLQNQCSLECETNGNWRPIHYACRHSYVDIVKLLLQNQCSLECETDGKWRPIHYACRGGNLVIVKLLLQNQCSLECETVYKWRPIHYACRSGNLDIVKYLVLFNCHLECRTQRDETPLKIARKFKQISCENFLKEILEHRRKIFDCVKRNDAQALNGLYSSTILMVAQPETGFSLLEVALQSNANEIIDYFLNKLVNVEEISVLENYMKNWSRPDAVQLIQECLLYRSIRFHDADGFHLSCSARTINGPGKLVKSSFQEIAAEHGCNAFINVLLEKSIYNEEEWTKAIDLAKLKGHREIAEAISNSILLRNLS